MGTTYTVILLDEFDWDYVDNSKEKAKAEFEAHFPVAELKGEWYGALVYDLNKAYPWADINQPFLLGFADAVYVQKDNSLVLEYLE